MDLNNEKVTITEKTTITQEDTDEIANVVSSNKISEDIGAAGLIEPYNFLDEFEWTEGKYYKDGNLVLCEDVMCTKPVRLFPGAMVRLSSFYNEISTEEKGTCISFWKDGEWKRDILENATMGVDYVTIPEDCNEISLTLKKSDSNKYVYIFGNDEFDDSRAILAIVRANYRRNELFEGKTVFILGDGISTYSENCTEDTDGNQLSDGTYTLEGNQVVYPNEELPLCVNETWWMRLINRNKMKLLLNDSYAGSSISPHENSDNDEVDSENYMASLTRVKRVFSTETDPDIVLVCGGVNDILQNKEIGEFNPNDNPMNYNGGFLDVSTFAKAYRAMIIRMMYYYPTSKVICVLPYLSDTVCEREKLDSYCNVMREICDYFGVKVVDFRECGIDKQEESKYFPDGVYPNSMGMELLFELINVL